MVFSSPIFLFLFFPFALLGYYLFRKKLGNLFLLIISLLFYAWGEPKFVVVMIATVLLDYLLGLWGNWARVRGRSTRPVIVMAAVLNVGLLFVFKYLNFATENLRLLLGDMVPLTQIVLPIGISFFTFQAMSYVFDVCAGKGEVQRNPLNVLLYVSLFPQLIAGPIVRYQTVAQEIKHRKETLDDFTYGIERFIIGFAKKAVLANTIGITVDYCFGLVGGQGGSGLTTGIAWLGAIGYSLQLYYDFSGYSDMAIGLGRMFGFHFEENFNYPYMTKSVGEFWRRWHISMGSWFRDYVYFPLGGSKVNGTGRSIFNLFVVWLLTGIWHGANWTFIVWGLWHFMWIAFERISGIPKRCGKLGSFFYRCISLLVVIIGWVIFRADSLTQAKVYLITMFTNCFGQNQAGFQYLCRYWPFYLAALIFCAPIYQILRQRMGNASASLIGNAMYKVILLLLFKISIVFCIAGTYNAFIYFNF